jgi:Tol biopolymer transport system component
LGVICLVLATFAVAAGSAGRDVTDTPLLLVESNRASGADGATSLYAVSMDGRALRRLSTGSLVAISPDERTVVVNEHDALFMLDADGSGRRRLPDSAFSGVWSTEGSTFAYDNFLADTLHVVGANGVERLRVSDANLPALAPDGHAVAFLVTEDHGHIERIAPDGTAHESLLAQTGVSVQDVAASPRGDRLVFALSRGADHDLFSSGPEGGALVRLTETKVDEVEPAWSPDGSAIAFVHELADGTAGVWIMRADGSEAHELTGGHADHHPDWSPDGRSIVFDRRDGPRSAQPHLYVISVESNEARALAPTTAWGPRWSPDGAGIVATVSGTRRTTAIGAFDTDGYIGALTDAGADSTPTFSPDGSQIAFVREGRLAVIAADGSAARFVTAGEERADAPSWSPAGLVYTTWPRSQAEDLDVLDVASGARLTIARDADPLVRPAWSPSGGAIAYRDPDGAVRIYELATRAHFVSEVEGQKTPTWSADGTMLATPDARGLRIVDDHGRRLLDVERAGEWAWSPTGATLGFVRGRASIEVVEPRAGKIDVLVPAEGERRIASLSWNSDGSTLAFSRERLAGVGMDVWVVDRRGAQERVTRPFPDGGDNELAGWLRAKRPPDAPLPANVRSVSPRIIAQTPPVLELHAGGGLPIYSSTVPRGGCGLLFLGGGVIRGAFNPCIGRHALLSVAATSSELAWTLQHEDEGIGDEDGACLYVVPIQGPPFKGRLPDCYQNWDRPAGRGQVEEIFSGSIGPVLAAGRLLVAGRRGYSYVAPKKHLEVRDVVRIDGGRMRSIVKRADALFDLDAKRILIRRGNAAVVVTTSGRVLRSLRVGRMLDAALDGKRIVVLTSSAIEQYDIASRARTARMPIPRGLGPQPVLAGASGGIAAYVEGAVVHIVRFADRRDAALRIADLAPPVDAALSRGMLTLGYQQEGEGDSGVVARIGLSAALG